MIISEQLFLTKYHSGMSDFTVFMRTNYLG